MHITNYMNVDEREKIIESAEIIIKSLTHWPLPSLFHSPWNNRIHSAPLATCQLRNDCTIANLVRPKADSRASGAEISYRDLLKLQTYQQLTAALTPPGQLKIKGQLVRIAADAQQQRHHTYYTLVDGVSADAAGIVVIAQGSSGTMCVWGYQACIGGGDMHAWVRGRR